MHQHADTDTGHPVPRAPLHGLAAPGLAHAALGTVAGCCPDQVVAAVEGVWAHDGVVVGGHACRIDTEHIQFIHCE